MISRFFIDRPIFATVLSIVITLTGGIALAFMPIAQYPRITPPGVAITISYPGASAQEVADTVGAPIEQQVNGIDGMLYMSSQSGNDGSYTLTVTFDIGTDIKTALVMVQNRVALALPQLPTAVQNQGITIRKRTPDMLMIINFFSPDGRYDDLYLSNFLTIYCRDELLRVDGISDVNIFGQRDYSMRVWLDPQKLAYRNMTAMDVATAVQNENVDAPAGRIGQPPIGSGQMFEFPLDALGRLWTTEQFGNIVVKVGGTPPIISESGVPVGPASSGGGSGSSGSASSTPSISMPGSSSSGSSMPSTSSSGGSSSGSSSSGSSSGSSGSSSGSSSTPSTMTGGGMTGTGSGAGTTSSAGMTGGSRGAMGMGASQKPPSSSSAIVRLRDVATIEVGALNYNTVCSFDGKPSVGIGLYQLPGTNALDVAVSVRQKMKELEKFFPDGVWYDIAYDTTPFISESVNDVKMTLLEAVGLVAIVVLVFLQSWRASIIPLVAVPVAIIGTFSVMAAIGFSLNNISLFGLVLAIGIVVDDAIVVVENVERWMDRGLDAREATRRAMDEVTGPIVAVGLVLCAVFVPCAFITGITGQFFRQFAVTIAVSTIFSTINSLTFSPAIAAILLRPKDHHQRRRDPLTWVLDMSLGWFFWMFNKAFGAGTNSYAWIVGKLMRLHLVVVVVYLGLLVLTVWTFRQVPTGFIPQQDQGRLIVNIQLPDSTSLDRTAAVALEVERVARETPGVAHTITNAGMSFILQANSPNFASMFIVLKPFSERQGPGLRDTDIMAKLRKGWVKQVPDAQVQVLGAAPVPGLGTAGGFKFLVEDRGGVGVRALEEQMTGLIQKFKKQPSVSDAKTQFRANMPAYFLDIDRTKVFSHGVSLDDVNQTLDIYLGSDYVNSYNDFGRHWQVTLQADGKFRTRIDNINLFEVRNAKGQMVPLSTVIKVRDIGVPISVTRYNLYTSAVISGNVAPGFSDGTAIQDINRTADATLPLTMRIEWTELMFLQIKAGNTAIYVFILSVVCVFMALSALYESWTLPLAVILVVPLCLLCSAAGVLFTHRDVNIFVQIGLVVLVGLACKNAILIVEFAKQLHQPRPSGAEESLAHPKGLSVFDATKEASRLRLRPILMTSFAFIFGVMPLMVASGAGAEMRRSLGVAVFSGMLGVTLFGIFLTPVFFYVIQGLSESSLFMSERARALGSYLTGGLLGALVGYLLAQIGIGFSVPQIAVGSWVWGSLVGGIAGFLIIRGLREVRERIKPDSENGSQNGR